MSTVEVALFPIPGSVSLPFDKVPLHIFEPRYRQMIQDCVAAHRRIGVAHTQGVLSPSKLRPDATREENLNPALRADLDKLFLLLGGDQAAAVEKFLGRPEWQKLSLFEYSFRIYSMIDLDPDILQQVLELRSTNERIQFLISALTPPISN